MKWIKKVTTTPIDTIAKVIDSLDQATNNRTNAPSIRAVNEALDNKWETIYPIGSIYLTVDPTFDPSVTFGGTWEQIKDRFLLSSGDTYSSGATGGSAEKSFDTDNHTLTINEMPSHLHEMARVDTSGAGSHDGIAKGTGSLDEFSTQTMGKGQGHNHSVTNIDIMPPYLVVNVWKRTA